VPYDRDKCAGLSAIVAVPLLLGFVQWLSELSRSRQVELLLVPPLAVIIYLIFARPDAPFVNLRSVVLTPILGAAVGSLCYRYLGFTPWGVAIATLVVLLAQTAARSCMPPALALAVLAMLLKAQGAGYTLDVALTTTLVWIIFLTWRRFVWRRLPPADYLKNVVPRS
jgi:CBS-domain-containing membrane protein